MKVRLHRPHTHAGIHYPAHHVIDLPDDDAKRLIELEGAVREEHVKRAVPKPIVAPVAAPE